MSSNASLIPSGPYYVVLGGSSPGIYEGDRPANTALGTYKNLVPIVVCCSSLKDAEAIYSLNATVFMAIPPTDGYSLLQYVQWDEGPVAKIHLETPPPYYSVRFGYETGVWIGYKWESIALQVLGFTDPRWKAHNTLQDALAFMLVKGGFGIPLLRHNEKLPPPATHPPSRSASPDKSALSRSASPDKSALSRSSSPVKSVRAPSPTKRSSGKRVTIVVPGTLASPRPATPSKTPTRSAKPVSIMRHPAPSADAWESASTAYDTDDNDDVDDIDSIFVDVDYPQDDDRVAMPAQAGGSTASRATVAQADSASASRVPSKEANNASASCVSSKEVDNPSASYVSAAGVSASSAPGARAAEGSGSGTLRARRGDVATMGPRQGAANQVGNRDGRTETLNVAEQVSVDDWLRVLQHIIRPPPSMQATDGPYFPVNLGPAADNILVGINARPEDVWTVLHIRAYATSREVFTHHLGLTLGWSTRDSLALWEAIVFPSTVS